MMLKLMRVVVLIQCICAKIYQVEGKEMMNIIENIKLIFPVVGNTGGAKRQARVEVGENYSDDEIVEKKDVEREDDISGGEMTRNMKLSYCLSVTLSHCHTVTLSQCHTVTLSHCQGTIMDAM